MRRGELWWGEFGPPLGSRPVVLITRDSAYDLREFVTVAPVSTKVRGIPAEVRLGRQDGVTRPSAVNLDNLSTVPKGRLQRRLSALGRGKLRQVDEALHFALGLED